LGRKRPFVKKAGGEKKKSDTFDASEEKGKVIFKGTSL